MITSTKYFGELTYDQKDMLYLPEGLFGFEEDTEYLLIHFEEDNNALLCLQSLQDEHLAFILTNPFSLMPNYLPELSEEDIEVLELSEDSPISFYVICVIYDQFADSTANLKCPIAINPLTRRARQVILEDDLYTFKHPFKEFDIQQKEGANC